MRPNGSILILLTLLAAACARSDVATGNDDALRARRGAFLKSLVLSGELVAERSVSLTVPAARGRRTSLRWFAENGTPVAAGQRVAELDTGEAGQNLRTALSRRSEAEEELARAEAEAFLNLSESELRFIEARFRLEEAERSAKVPADLLAANVAATREVELERARTNLEKAERDLAVRRAEAEAQVGDARSRLEAARRELAAAERTVALYAIDAPHSGLWILADHPWEGRKLQTGDVLWPGFPLGGLPDLGSLVAIVRLLDVDVGRIHPGATATVVLDAFPETALPATVRTVAPLATEPDRRSSRRVFDVMLDVEHLDPARHRPGMSVRAEVLTARRPDALLVARAAVDTSRSPMVVRTAHGNVEAPNAECNPHDCAVDDATLEAGIELLRIGG